MVSPDSWDGKDVESNASKDWEVDSKCLLDREDNNWVPAILARAASHLIMSDFLNGSIYVTQGHFDWYMELPFFS